MAWVGLVRPAGQGWGEAVFHVLAHIPLACPASVYDPRYVEFARDFLGPSEGRCLAEDARALGQLAADHDSLARLQLLAWLFDDIEQARSVERLELKELTPEMVAHPELLGALVGAPAELLRCAALLELPELARMPEADVPLAELSERLLERRALAPLVGEAQVRLVRALRLRGRLYAGEIWVGAPEARLGLGVQHVVWQALHEACVWEVGRVGVALAERQREHTALVLLAERARDAGFSAEHATWFSHLGQAPRAQRSALVGQAQRALELCRERSG